MGDFTGPAPLDTLEEAWKKQGETLAKNLSNIENKLKRPNLSDQERKGYNYHKEKVMLAIRNHQEERQLIGLI